MPDISVLMPCYNVAATVDEAIASLVTQSLPDFDAVLVDDGSTDDTLNCLQAWVDRDQRIRVLQRPHQGIIMALNAGLEACRSEYIARMDADDRSSPQRLSRQVSMLTEHPEYAVISSLVKGFPADNLGHEFKNYIDWLNSLLTDVDIKFNMFLQSPLAHPSVAYRREWVLRLGGYEDHGWAEDYDLWVRLFLAGANFCKIPEVLVEWRDHPQRLTHTDGRYSKQSDLRLKAHYLAKGPLFGCDEIIIWGTSTYAQQLGDQLIQLGCPLSGYVTTQPLQEEHLNLMAPVIHLSEFHPRLHSSNLPIVLVAENDPIARKDAIQQLRSSQLQPGISWWVTG
jgi:glycosyltransferase involved in cell wall biosynthesis